MVKNEKGDRRERELVNLLYEGDWAVMRAPASGSATQRELPDVLCGNGHFMYAIEAKSSGGNPIYLTEEEVEALNYFANNFGAYGRIGVKFDAEYEDPWYGNDDDSGWRFFNPMSLHRTPGGNFRVKKEDLPDGKTVDDIANGPL